MATLFYIVTDTPVNLVGAALVLADLTTATTTVVTVDTNYSIRFLDDAIQGPMKVLEAVAAPAAGHQALPVFHQGDFFIRPVTGEGVYVWSEHGAGILVINEVPD